MKKLTQLLLLSILIFMLAGCSGTAVDSTGSPVSAETVISTETNTAVSTTTQTEIVTATAVPVTVKYASEDLETSSAATAATTIILSGDAITVEGEGAVANGSSVTITAAGTYSISGTLNNGQIIVETTDEEPVILVLNGVDITYTSSAPIYVSNADKVVIALADGTENVVTDGDTYQFPDAKTDEPNAAIFSNDDLTINGSGSLIVNANYNNGIDSNDDLKITGGTITVNAVNDGIKGRDSIAIKDAAITINAGGDGLQSNNDEDAEKGYIVIESGTINITAGQDGIQAETSLNISGGTIAIDAADDGLNANNSITINGGDIVLAAGDDGVHADAIFAMNDGNLTISQSYEGIESGIIIINCGAVHLTASDDGVNVSSGEGGGGRPGQTVSGDYYLEINGGYLYVDAGGDGLDSNGLGTLNGGVVIVNGPIMNMNGTLDVDGMLTINGGFLVGVGSAGMAQSPSTASTQYSVLQMMPAAQSAGSMVHIESEAGQEIVTFVPTKSYEMIIVSSPELENGMTYLVYTGGSATGTVTDGLYTDGAYSAGTQVASFTISSIVTGESSGMGGRGGRPSRP